MKDKLMPSHWTERIKHWGTVTPPLIPHQDTVTKIQSLVGSNTENVLLLGVTKQLAEVFPNLLAIDRQPEIVEHLWIGDTDTRKALNTNWLTHPFQMDSFSAVIGDGSINMLEYPLNVKTMFSRIHDILRPGGVCAVRFFTRPMEPMTREHLVTVVNGETKVNLAAFNRMILAYIAENEGPMVPNLRIYQVFSELVQDRELLCKNTGWDITFVGNTFDSYIHSKMVSSMMNRSEILKYAPSGSNFVESEGYDYAENCPILTFTK